MSNQYWPWWAGAIGLAGVAINYTVATGRSFGVSSAWERVLNWRPERHAEQADTEFADERELADALAAATAAQFGTPAASPSDAGPAGVQTEVDASLAAEEPPPVASLRPAPVVSQAVLLGSIFVGGSLAAVTGGRFDVRLDMGDGFREIVTGNPVRMVGVLFLGGVLVGFGTRLAGGCSSGHGLYGVGRLQPASILATAVFFGTAVAVSLLLWKVL